VNRLDLARSLAKKSHRSQAKAADAVDNLVYHLLKQLKHHPTTGQKTKQPSERIARPRAET
jgi:uncharacterized protein (DUF2345 family)